MRMTNILIRLKHIVQDPIFERVAVCLFSLPFAALGIWGIKALSPPEGWWWMGILFLIAVATYGSFLFYAACFGSKLLFERATRYIHDGGDEMTIVFVALIGIVAIPITLLFGWLRCRYNK
jgi:glucan phosphoethanolaminetransferase (alkaline phosphatase superfamily)